MHAALPDPADIHACRAALRAGSSSFHTAGLLLPRHVRDHASALYAFCRVADDAADIGGRRESIEALRGRLDAVYAQRPRADPIDRAFAAVVALHAVPRELPEALLEGLAWDIEGRSYETLADLEAYAARVAGSVGAMMALVMGVRDPQALARACDLGVAMQLTNIARDIGEDARLGRIYLPLAWLREAGLDAKQLCARPSWSPALQSVVTRLLAAADALYVRSGSGIRQLPFGCRTGIHAARLIYADIGTVVRTTTFDPIVQRAVVPTRRKLALVLQAATRAAGQGLWPRRDAIEPALSATQYLVAAAAAAREPAQPPAEGRVVWLLDLFERLERRKVRQEGQAWTRVLSP